MADINKPTALAIVGPTAAGKSALAMALANVMPIEIVCMDSMQIYRGFDIGTAKPSKAEQSLVVHHMVNICAPEQSFSVAEYVQAADASIRDIAARGRLPVLVGGTGLYLRALRYDLTLGNSAGDEQIRRTYQELLEAQGAEKLHARLLEKDPAAATRIHPNNTRRVIRALEVIDLTGLPFSGQQMPGKEGERYRLHLFGTRWERATLYRRIDARVARMAEDGLFEEVRGLLDAGVRPDAQSMQGLGYKEAIPYLEGSATLGATLALISRKTRNYAKRQMTWFTREADITWFDMENDTTEERVAAMAARMQTI